MEPDREIDEIQRHFHELIRQRAGSLVKQAGVKLPTFVEPLRRKDRPVWLPIPGMAGGFNYWFQDDDDGGLRLVTESWSRVVDGSGQRHEITSSGARLTDEGFV